MHHACKMSSQWLWASYSCHSAICVHMYVCTGPVNIDLKADAGFIACQHWCSLCWFIWCKYSAGKDLCLDTLPLHNKNCLANQSMGPRFMYSLHSGNTQTKLNVSSEFLLNYWLDLSSSNTSVLPKTICKMMPPWIYSLINIKYAFIFHHFGPVVISEFGESLCVGADILAFVLITAPYWAR